MLRTNRFLALASLSAATFLAPAAAHAQTTSTASITPSGGQPNPERFVNGADVGVSTRPQNLTPLGINYSDCIQDMVLSFKVVVTGFDGNENLQVWASKTSDCTAATDRGVGGSGSMVPTCWLVNPGFTAQRYTSPQALPFDVRVQDLVGLQNLPPYPANYVRQGPSACTAQSTFAAVGMTINFVPINSGNGSLAGTAFQYKISTDLIGPPAPANVKETVGDTLFIVTWNPNNDSDTASYDLFIDPIPGQEGNTSTAATDASTILVCPESGTPAATLDSSLDALDGGDDGSTADAAVVASSDDAVCHYLKIGGMSVPQSGNCTSSVLASAIVQDGGFVQEVDDAGNPIEGGLISTSGGLSTIPCQNLIPACSTGVTASDRSTGTYTIKGLVNNDTYNVVVAAVDNSGNIGPPSSEVCDFPAPVNDFWNVYRQSGGGAGGGFCALEAVGEPVPCAAGIALALMTSALVLRRRRKRR